MERPTRPTAPQPLRLALLGTHPPRKCGIATFTRDLGEAVAGVHDNVSIRVLAVNDAAGPYDYPGVVRFEVRQGVRQDYIRAADQINYSDVQLVCVQHEFGIYGGDDGAHLLAFLAELRKPAIATLHTVLRKPSDSQRAIVRTMAERCGRLIVMSQLASDLLVESHGIPRSQIQIIPHGIPDLPRGDQEECKARFGVAGRRMMLTFGLLGPNKGIETVLRALPQLIDRFPDIVYFLVGATHPNVKRQRGEEYRTFLEQEAKDLGVVDHVVFRDEFVSSEELADLLRASDVYVTPYRSEAQSTSGTLAFAMGAGTAVVSTPYWHAQELLADGRGRMFDFGDSKALAGSVGTLFSHPGELQRGRPTWLWPSESWPRHRSPVLAPWTPSVFRCPICDWITWCG
jgi:glycosyltransferase involved in cell wall biosynthesis